MLPSAVVLRRALVLLCAVVLIQETNRGSLIVGAECFQKCADGIASGHCSPICATCASGTHANPVSPRLALFPAPATSKNRGFAEAALATGDLHLPDILHVPKRLAA